MAELKVGKEYELYDINEEVTPQNIKDKVMENVNFLLKREKVLRSGEHAIMPMSADNWEMGEEDRLDYVGNFELFDRTGNNIIAYGTVRGYGLGNSLQEIEVQITEVIGPLHKVLKKKSPRGLRGRGKAAMQLCSIK